MKKTKSQAQKREEAAEKAAAREAERLEFHAAQAEKRRQEGLAAQELLKKKKADKKKEKTTKSISNTTSPPQPVLPSASEVAHMSHVPTVPSYPTIHNSHSNSNEDDFEDELSNKITTSSLNQLNHPSPTARIIFNHTSYIDGLSDFCRKLQKHPAIKTIHPGQISDGQAHVDELTIQYQSDSNDGAFNFVAKSESCRQDLRITPVKIANLTMIQTAIEEILHPIVVEPPSASLLTAPISISANDNRAVAQLASQLHRTKDQQKYAHQKEKEREAAHAKKVAEKTKRLKAAIGQKNEKVGALAEKWVEWEK